MWINKKGEELLMAMAQVAVDLAEVKTENKQLKERVVFLEDVLRNHLIVQPLEEDLSK